MSGLTKTDIPKFLEAGLQAAFFNEYNKPIDKEWEKIAMVIQSNKSLETYSWLGATPLMREWKDERMPGTLNANDFTITNKKFEASMRVDKDAIDDDQYGQVAIRARQLGETARQYDNDRVFDVLAAGEASTYGLCYDENEFFDTQHADSGAAYTTVQSNLGSSALSAASLTAAKLAMRKFKDDRGRVMNIIPDTMVIPPDLEDTAMKLLKSITSDASGNINVHQGAFNLVVTPRITDADAWYLLNTNGVTKPLIFQDRQAVEFSALEGETDSGFMRDEYIYGVKRRFAVGYGDWRRAYANTP